MKSSVCGGGKRVAGPRAAVSVDRAQLVIWMSHPLCRQHQITGLCVQVHFQFIVSNKFVRLEHYRMQATEVQS